MIKNILPSEQRRVKCISLHAYPGARKDPQLVRGKFYTVLDTDVRTIADETPYIRVLSDGVMLERPRHLFGPVLIS